MKKNIFSIIMAGGIGSRFWPLSRTEKPKQFLDILGVGKTLLQQTYDRMLKICPSKNIYIVTNSDYYDLVATQLPDIDTDQILLEPTRRNTAPCIAYANYKIMKKNPDALIVTAPSDHLILKENEFIAELKKGLEFVGKNDALVTLGIKPHRIETGYGYIQIDSEESVEIYDNLFKVKTFTEKPNYELAKVFFESGEFYWNSGIFIWTLKDITNAFEEFLPEIDALFKDGINIYSTPLEKEFISRVYSDCKNISIDYGIMEKAENVFVLCSDFGWSDLGTWGSLYENLKKDDYMNIIKGKNVLTYDTRGCIINVPDDKLVTIQGLEDYIVVESDNMLLICKKRDEQKIRQIVNDVRLEKGEKFI
ncbi:MAG: mannose-1-phosphate guanylyltransferase [Bacteroidia bacterium]|nr:mannose-1-phosphate guanylyltransferase [Bacteroidia bacterium]